MSNQSTMSNTHWHIQQRMHWVILNLKLHAQLCNRWSMGKVALLTLLQLTKTAFLTTLSCRLICESAAVHHTAEQTPRQTGQSSKKIYEERPIMKYFSGLSHDRQPLSCSTVALRMCQCGLHAALWLHISTLTRLLDAETRSTAGLLFPSQYLCGTILVTPYSMVWNWLVSRAGLMPFYWPSSSLLFCLLPFSLSLLSFCVLVLWGWGLRADRVLIVLSLPCIVISLP